MKKPGFVLNLHDRAVNPCFEAHDPSMMWDPAGGCYYSYATDSALTSPYRQGIPVRRSRDLVNFEFLGYALSEAAIAQGRDNGAYPPTRGFWAPYAEYCKGEYRMYYSATRAFGSSESRIWLAVSDRPEGPFENRGVVMDTWHTPDTEPNAIDPHVEDTPEGKKYLIYGSFFGGIFIKELDPLTGMPVNPDPHYQGRRIAKRPAGAHVDGPEGASVLFYPETGYYYLFLSYGWLGDDYDIRVGRSRQIMGPYLDFHGKNLDGESLGLKLAGSYRFAGEAPCQGQEEKDWKFAGFRGPGHGVPFWDPTGKGCFFIHHVRDGARIFLRPGRWPGDRDSYRMHYMMVRRMFFAGGWPLLSPEPYAGEQGEASSLEEFTGTVDKANVEGKNEKAGAPSWEWLRFPYGDNSLAEAEIRPLPEDLDSERTLVFTGFDFENGCEGVFLSGITKGGEVLWGKYEN